MMQIDEELKYEEMTLEQASLLIDTRTLAEKEQGLCPVCHEYKASAQCRKQNTAYVNEIDNFVLMCDECFKDNEAYWKERWNELYSEIHAGIAAGNLSERM